MNNEIVIEFGFRIILRIMEIEEGVRVYQASADNTLLDLHNSSNVLSLIQ